MNQVEPEIHGNAVSIYGQDNYDEEFPVLKAFQQYIDAEQAKGRKRLMIMAIFFFVIMMVVVAIFVGLLVNMFNENQRVNDRLLDYAMKDRERSASVVVNPQSDNAAVLSLTAKIEELQAKIADDRSKVDAEEKARFQERLRLAEEERKVAEAEKKAAEEMQKRLESLKKREEALRQAEIDRLKALLAAEKEKSSAAKENEERRKKQLEEYRRKYYPQYNAPKKRPSSATDTDEDDDIVPISYFDEERGSSAKTKSPSVSKEKEYSIPVDKKESSTLDWDLP